MGERRSERGRSNDYRPGPVGDLTRAGFASEASGCDFGTVAATVTVQELTFNLMLILCALAVLLAFHLGVAIVVTTLLRMAATAVILTVSPVFCAVHHVVAHIPLLKRLLPVIDQLQRETADLLHRPDTWGLSARLIPGGVGANEASVQIIQGREVLFRRLQPEDMTWSQWEG